MTVCKSYSILVVFFLAVPLVSQSRGQESESWTQWRGAQRDARADSDLWGETLEDSNFKRIWRVDLGPSYSGPLIVGNRVYSTESRQGRDEVVFAFDRDTGEKIWETSWTGSMKVPFFANRNGSWIRSTPAYSDGKIYVAGMKDYLVCLDAEDGEQIWVLDFMAKFGSKKPDFGCACSPLIDGDDLYLQAGGACYKLNKHTGEVIWKAADDGGGMYGSAFSSPMIANLAGKRQLLIQTRTTLMGIEIETGKTLWSQNIPAFRGMNILTPIVSGNYVFTSAYQNKSHLFEISQNNGSFTSTELWQEKKRPAYMSSPVIIDDHLYLHLQSGRFMCRELKTGREKWVSRPEGEYASLVAGHDRFLALRSDGKLMMIKANPEKFEVVSEKQLTEQETWAHLAACQSDLVVREQNGLSLFRWQEP